MRADTESVVDGVWKTGQAQRVACEGFTAIAGLAATPVVGRVIAGAECRDYSRNCNVNEQGRISSPVLW